MNETAKPNAEMPVLKIEAQYIKDLSFENPNAAKVLSSGGEPPAVQINVDVKANKGNNDMYEVSLHIQSEARMKGDLAFLCELVYAGIFTLKNIPQEQLQAVLLIECPRLLFPFARAVVADATREGGYAPLLIHPIDFAGLYLKQQQVAAQGDQGNAGNKKEAKA